MVESRRAIEVRRIEVRIQRERQAAFLDRLFPTELHRSVNRGERLMRFRELGISWSAVRRTSRSARSLHIWVSDSGAKRNRIIAHASARPARAGA